MPEMIRHWNFKNHPEKWAEVDKEVNLLIAEGWTIINTSTNIVGESIEAQVVYEVRFDRVKGMAVED
jgi:hypothetical protein